MWRSGLPVSHKKSSLFCRTACVCTIGSSSSGRQTEQTAAITTSTRIRQTNKPEKLPNKVHPTAHAASIGSKKGLLFVVVSRLRRRTLCFSFEYRMGRRIPRYVQAPDTNGTTTVESLWKREREKAMDLSVGGCLDGNAGLCCWWC